MRQRVLNSPLSLQKEQLFKSALTSYEKLQSEIWSLYGAIDIPLLDLGELNPMTNPSQIISNGLRKSKPQDRTVPMRSPEW